MVRSIADRLAAELACQPGQVEAAIALFDGGATVPFVARYRKEATGGLDDTQLRRLAERLDYLRELDDRRAAILKSIGEQDKLSPELQRAIEQAETKVALEDLYLPYRPKRRTKATIAREAGLEPLAQALLADPSLDPTAAAAGYVDPDKGVTDPEAALEGARFLLMEQFAEDAQLLQATRTWLEREAALCAKVQRGKQDDPEAQRFRDYFEHDEPLRDVPAHRALAMLRAHKEGFVELGLGLGEPHEPVSHDPTGEGQQLVMQRFGLDPRAGRAAGFLCDTARLCFRARLATHLESQLLGALRERAEAAAIDVFAANLRDLLLAAPAGSRTILGLDPGLRTGCKVAVVDRTGKVLATTTIFPHVPRNDWVRSLDVLAELCRRFEVDLVAVGNGTGSRETDKLAGELIARCGDARPLQKVMVSEAGASVYSASEGAANELPDLDVSLRSAVSIARRLQDPLAELVKIEPKAIGVGQYQHDVNQSRLARALDGVVEDCVNRVGVDLNTASEALLMRVAGLSRAVAQNIVAWRDRNGAFRSRRQLLDVPRLGAKAYEQCAGFLRIRDGDDPLDRSAVHPEAYPVVERILQATGRSIDRLLGDRSALHGLDPQRFTDERFGLPTVRDILAELEKPGRDPRPEFKTAAFREGVEQLSDLEPGMTLEGVVTNVTDFGAFVDIGVHQDGLVHISQLSDRFVEDPREVVRAGQVVTVKVLAIDAARQRVSLSMRLHERPQGERGTEQPRDRSAGVAGRRDPGRRDAGRRDSGRRDTGRRDSGARAQPEPISPLAAQLAKLGLRKN